MSFYLTLKYGREKDEIPVQLVDEEGNGLDLEDPELVVEFEEPSKTITFKNIVDAKQGVYSDDVLIGRVSGTSINTITVNGVIYEYDQTNISNDKDAEGLQYRGEKWQYKDSAGEFSELDDQTITFVYKKQASTEAPAINGINTVDTDVKGIDLKLFNYNEQINGGSKSDVVAPDRALTFKNDGEGVDGTNKKRDGNNHPIGWLNADKYGGGLAQGIVQNTLQEGYPVTSAGRDGNRSLQYLFDADYDTVNDNLDNAVTEYPANYLFTYDPDTGYYEYDSAKNAANYDTQNNRFNVYNYTEAANTESGKENEGSFLPFNNAQAADAAGSWSDRKFLFEEETVDYWFGMSMTAEFIQPKGGKVNGQEMVFEFTGDDDVWVFIDGKLVLDLGGVHSAVSGSINFATGVVSITDTKGDNVTNVSSLNEIFELEGNTTFDDYSTHTIEYFYLERGGDVANCHIKFNLPTIPEEDLAVAKTVTQLGTNDQVSNSTPFSFVLKENGTPKGGVSYNVYDLDDYTANPEQPGEAITSGKTGDGGIFKLKANQVAVFENLVQDGDASAYTVTEQLGDTLAAQVSGVYVNGESSGNYTAEFENGTYALFNNRIKDKGEYDLELQKKWKSKSGADLNDSAIPFSKIEVDVVQYYKTGTGDTTQKLNQQTLVLSSENGWKASYGMPIKNYTSFKVESEKIYIEGVEAPIVTYFYNGENWTASWPNPDYEKKYEGWTIGEFVFSRDYGSATLTGDGWRPNCNNLNIDVPGGNVIIINLATNGAELVGGKNFLVWMPSFDNMPENAQQAIKEAAVKSGIYSSLKSTEQIVFYDPDKYPDLMTGVKIAYNEDGIVNIQMESTDKWRQVAWRSFQFSDNTISASLTNTLDTTTATTSVTVEKEWLNGNNQVVEAPENITEITVYLKNKKDSRVVQAVKLNSYNRWRYTFDNLPTYNTDGTLAEYIVEEAAVQGYTPDYIPVEGGFIIQNRPSNGKLIIMKEIKNDAGQNVAGFGGGKDVFSFKITDTDGKTWYMHVNGAGTAVVTGTEAEDEKFIELPAGTYTVSELDNLNYDSTKTKVQVGTGESQTATSTTVTISGNETVVTFTNTPKSDPGITDGSGVINSFQKDGNVITITGTPVKNEDGSKDDTVVTDKTTTSGN